MYTHVHWNALNIISKKQVAMVAKMAMFCMPVCIATQVSCDQH